MNALNIYTSDNISAFVNKRAGETKFGELLQSFSSWDDLRKSKVKYVIFGIPEDIGVRANYGNPGAAEAWNGALRALCNIQANHYFNPERVLILGDINCKLQMQQANDLNKDDPHYVEKLGELVIQIDHKVSEVMTKIVTAGKFPIIIGGGHNNSYGNIRGTSRAHDKSINCLNFDAHTDFRALEHRHSGNGFSYAFEEGYLKNYFIFGLHQNYTSQTVFNTIQKNRERVKFNLYEDISIREKITFSEAIRQAEAHCCDSNFGLELDMDAIASMGSSAMTPGGFTLTEARRFIDHFTANQNCSYLHICEGAPGLGLFPTQVSKTIAYIISDVISR